MDTLFKRVISMAMVAVFAISMCFIPSQPTEAAYASVPIYRLNNPNTGEYLFTTDTNEVNYLSTHDGWKNEGIGWNAPVAGEPIYRLYDPSGYHLYTSDTNEIKHLTTVQGWSVDNGNKPMFYSGGSTVIYRLYHPVTGQHLLTGKKSEADSFANNGWNREPVNIMAESVAVTNPEYVRAIWISFLDWQRYLKGKTEAGFRQAFEQMCDKAIEYKINTLFVHVRSHNDAAYPSQYYPWSTEMLSGIPNYDPLEIMCSIAHGRNLAIHAWVNPYGYRNGVYSGDQSLSTKENIVNGVRELATNYDVDGVHFDDYFPIDSMEKHNALIREAYQAAHSAGKLFGISPAGEIGNNHRYGADVDRWLSEPGYVDYIAPQLYWSDHYSADGSRRYYTETLNAWLNINKLDIPMYIALALYKVKLPIEHDPGWTTYDNNLIEQIKLADAAGCEGYGYFRFAFLESDVTQTELANVLRETK